MAVDTPDNLTARLRGSETMYVQVDAAAADARAGARAVPGVTRVGDRRRSAAASSASRWTAKQGRDVRRELAAAIVSARLGTARAAPDAHEPRGDLPAADDRGIAAGAGSRAGRRWPMNNILAIAHKELQAYFASPIAYIVIGFFALLFGWFFFDAALLLRSAEHAGRLGMGGRQAVNVNEQLIGPLFHERRA